MKDGDEIVIRAVSNGWLVFPASGIREPVYINETFVFQDMGYVSSARDYQKTEDTLCGFIAKHFSKQGQ